MSITLSTKQLPPIAERMAQTWGHLQIRHEKYAKFSQLGSVLKSETGSPDFLKGYITTLTFISISLSLFSLYITNLSAMAFLRTGMQRFSGQVGGNRMGQIKEGLDSGVARILDGAQTLYLGGGNGFMVSFFFQFSLRFCWK